MVSGPGGRVGAVAVDIDRSAAVGFCSVNALVLGGYFLNLQSGAELDIQRGVMTQSVLQKVITYLSVLCLSLIVWAVRTRALHDERVSS